MTGPTEVRWCCRSPQRPAGNPDRVLETDLEIWSFDRATDALCDFPAMISATSAKRHPVSHAEVTAALADRSEYGILVDMAMPPDFLIPETSMLDYVDIDHLARLAGRRPRLDDADEFVRSAALDSYRRLSDHQRVGPLIKALMSRADRIVEDATDRFVSRLDCVDDEPVVRNAAHNVARTLLAGPVEYIKDAGRTRTDLESFAEAFGIAEATG